MEDSIKKKKNFQNLSKTTPTFQMISSENPKHGTKGNFFSIDKTFELPSPKTEKKKEDDPKSKNGRFHKKKKKKKKKNLLCLTVRITTSPPGSLIFPSTPSHFHATLLPLCLRISLKNN